MRTPHFLIAACVLAAIVATTGPPAPASAVQVPCAADALVTAIETANADPTQNILELATDCTYTLDAVNNQGYHGDNGLPQVQGTLSITGTRSVIQRGTESTVPMFRLIQVNEGAVLAVRGIEFRNGVDEFSSADEKGGAILNQGVLVVYECNFFNNQAGCGGAIWTSGALAVTQSTFAANTGDN